MHGEPIAHRELLEHASFLRRLARDLVQDPSRVDDAVQDVWLRALQRPPRHGSNLRGWLRVVLTHHLRSAARAAAVRPDRDAQASVAGELAGRDPGVEDVAALRAVTEAVLALEEPLRSLVVQHYYHGRTLAEIAERSDTPVSTLKSRLQRALGLLRTRLKAGTGEEWPRALRALALMDPLAAPAAGSAVAPGVLLMSTKVTCAVAMVVLLVGAAWWWSQHEGADSAHPELQAGSLSQASHPDGAGASGSPPFDSVPTEARREALSEAAPSGPVPLSAPIRFRAVLRDEEGRAVIGAWSASFTLTDSDGFVRTGRAPGPADGTFTFASLAPRTYWFEASAHGYLGRAGVVELAASELEVERDITLPRAPRLRVRITTPAGQELLSELSAEARLSRPATLRPFATRERPGEWMTEIVGSVNNPVGIGQFWNYGPDFEALGAGYAGYLLLDEPLPAFVSLAHAQRVLSTVEVFPGQEEVSFVLSRADVEASFGTLRLRAVEELTGTPVPSASAVLDGPTEVIAGGSKSPRTDTAGELEVRRVAPGNYVLILIAEGRTSPRRVVRVEAGGVTDLGTIELAPTRQVELRVEHGGRSAGARRFQLDALDPAVPGITPRFQDWVRSRDDGVLDLSWVEPGHYVLRSAEDGRYPFSSLPSEALVSGNVVLDLSRALSNPVPTIELRLPVQLLLDCGPGTPFKSTVVIADGAGHAYSRVRVDRAGPVAVALCEGSYALTLVAADGSVLAEATALLDKPVTRVELRPRR